MRSFVLLAVLALAFVACTPVVAAGADDELEWIQPAFIEDSGDASAHLAPVGSFNHEHEPRAMVEATATAEARVDAMLGATVTAHGKSHAQLMAELEVRGPGLWAEFKAKFAKRFSDEKARFSVFMKNLVRIAAANAKAFFSKVPKALRVVYSHLTEFAAHTKEEFQKLLGTNPNGPNLAIAPKAVPRTIIGAPRKTSTSTRKPIGQTASRTPKGARRAAAGAFLEMETEAEAEADQAPRNLVQASVVGEKPATGPVDIDFREYGSPVISQGKCGSCYAFAATHVLESHWAIKTGVKKVLSPQQLMDCFKPMAGCSGGNPTAALQFWRDSNGAATIDEVPYLAKPSNGTCVRPAAGSPKPKDVSYAIPRCRGASCGKPDEDEMGHQLSSSGPLLIIMDASAYQFYKSGVMASDAPCSQDPAKGNHALSVEGLGTDAATGQRYWIVRNSWGPNWGEGGRLRVAFGTNTCGIASTGVTKLTM